MRNTRLYTEAATVFLKKKMFLKNFQISQGKNRFRPATLLIRDSKHRYFPVKFTISLRTPILKNICERLLLHITQNYWVISWFRANSIVLHTTYRSSHWRCPVKKAVLRNFTKFLGKHLCQRIFFNKVAGLTSGSVRKLCCIFILIKIIQWTTKCSII